MNTVFVLQYVRPGEDGEEDVKMIGVYRTQAAAMAAVNRLCNQPGFRNHPRLYDPESSGSMAGFTLDQYPVDQDHWTEGFGWED